MLRIQISFMFRRKNIDIKTYHREIDQKCNKKKLMRLFGLQIRNPFESPDPVLDSA